MTMMDQDEASRDPNPSSMVDEEVEEGELPDDDSDSEDLCYTPLTRPQRETQPSHGATSAPGEGEMSVNNLILAGPRPRSSTNSSTMANAGDNDHLPGESPALSPHSQAIDSSESDLFPSSSDEDSSNDGSGAFRRDAPRPKRKRRRPQRPEASQEESMDQGGHGGADFQVMVTQFQKDRMQRGLPTRKGGQVNNIWGSILQEESLNNELNNIAMGRNLRDLNSDRGSETYDYVMAQKIAMSLRERDGHQRERAHLDEELQDYWDNPQKFKSADDHNHSRDDDHDELHHPGANGMDADTRDSRRNGAIRAGKKRSVKERLGAHPSHHRPRGSCEREVDEDLSIPQPGVPRTIADLSNEVLESENVAQLGQEISHKLSEPKTELMIGVVDIVGKEIALDLFRETQQIEAQGGLMIKNGARRRTPGGLFLHLLRLKSAKDSRIDESKIKCFFAQSNQRIPKANSRRRKPGGDDVSFELELASFKKLSEQKKTKHKMETDSPSEARGSENAESDLKPLPDILSCISKKFGEASSRLEEDDDLQSDSLPGGSKGLAPFEEPEAPPNSVERTLNTYEDESDDFLYADTENIELF